MGALALGLLFGSQRLRSRKAKRIFNFVIAAAFTGVIVLYLAYITETPSAGFTDLVLLTFANYTGAVVLVQLLLHISPCKVRACATLC